MERDTASPLTQAKLKEQGRNALGTSGDAWAPEAMELVRSLGSKFGGELAREAITIAKRETLDAVSKRHVEEAHQKLRAQHKRAWFARFAGTLGGACLGCAIALLITTLQTEKPSVAVVIAMFVLSSIGTGLGIYHALRSR